MRAVDPRALARFATAALREAAVPADAAPMQAYMKTNTPFFGVKKPARVRIERELKRRFAPEARAEYEAGVRALWSLPHREEKYLALAYAAMFPRFVDAASFGLYESLIREGAWWDLVDDVVSRCVSPAYRREREALRPTIRRWIDDDDLWLRRAALLAQLKHKADTDAGELFEFCRRRAHEREFFIRKAIGWALREYARVAPDAVRAFLEEHGDALSGLSRREASKHL